VLKDEIDGGIDELGVLLLSDRHPSLWLGSQLSIHKARELAPHNNATSLQVVGSMMAAIERMQCHPRAGIIESEALDHDFVLAHARRYWEPIVHQFRHWHPETERHPQRWTLDEFVEFRPPVEPTSVARALETAAWPSLMRMKECGQDAGRRGDAHLPRSWPPFDERR
jgi:homospermidine synthase